MATFLDKKLPRGSLVSVFPPPELRKRLETEALAQNRSLNNMVIVILLQYFKDKDGHKKPRRGNNGAVGTT